MPAAFRLLIPLAIAFCALLVHPGCPGERPGSRQPTSAPILTETDGAIEYTFHVVTGGEALFDLDRDPRRLTNLIRKKPAPALRMRESLENRLGVADITLLVDPDDPLRRALEHQGYL